MRWSRRKFLHAATAASALLPFRKIWDTPKSAGIYSERRTQAQLAADSLRPRFHLLPEWGWMNDPNGPIFWKGRYHMFFQYNPNAAVWGDMHWAHAMSPDMIHWTHLPLALAPTPGGYDSEGCFSGSAVDDAGKVTIIYTGVKTVPPSEATLRDGTHNFLETQCLATASDKELRDWKRLPAPLLLPPKEAKLTGFRDPCLWRDGKMWFMAVGSGLRGEGGCALLYRSADLRNWEYVHELAKGRWNGSQTKDPVDSGEMWECPDFFALDGKHVLLYSTERKVYWESGEFDSKEAAFHPRKHGLLDYGAYYAPKSQLDAQGRRILWGWIPETRPETEFSAAGWAGCMSLPRALRLDRNGELQMTVIPGISQLREEQLVLPASVVGDETRRAALDKMTLNDASAEIELEFRTKPFNFQVADGAQSIFSFRYEPSNTGRELQIGERSLSLPASTDKPTQMRMYLDGSVVECLFNGSLAYTARTYCVPKGKLRIDIAKEELAGVHELAIWPLRAISPDRLTS